MKLHLTTSHICITHMTQPANPSTGRRAQDRDDGCRHPVRRRESGRPADELRPARRQSAARDGGRADGVGRNGSFTDETQIPCILPYFVLRAHELPHCATSCHMLVIFCHIQPAFPGESSLGGFAALCHDPVCPDPVWKLSNEQGQATRRTSTESYIRR